MKDWKKEIVDDIVKKSVFESRISLYKVAVARGYNHIDAGDCRDIVTAVLRECPDYTMIRLAQHPGQTAAAASIFTSGTFVRRGSFVPFPASR